MEDSLHQLREALRSKDGPMKVATTRFAVRAKRPNVEQTRDYVHGGLLSEINDIGGSQEALKVRYLGCFLANIIVIPILYRVRIRIYIDPRET